MWQGRLFLKLYLWQQSILVKFTRLLFLYWHLLDSLESTGEENTGYFFSYFSFNYFCCVLFYQFKSKNAFFLPSDFVKLCFAYDTATRFAICSLMDETIFWGKGSIVRFIFSWAMCVSRNVYIAWLNCRLLSQYVASGFVMPLLKWNT